MEGRGGEGSATWAWAWARLVSKSRSAVDKPRGVQSWPGCGLLAVMRLLIQQASWCCGPERGRLGSPREGSKYPIIDQFSLSVRTGPGQRSGSDSPGGPCRSVHGLPTDDRLARSSLDQAPAGPLSPLCPTCAIGFRAVSLATSFRGPAGFPQPGLGCVPCTVRGGGHVLDTLPRCQGSNPPSELRALCCFLVPPCGHRAASWGPRGLGTCAGV